MTETWDSMDVAPAVTQYKVQQQATPRRLEVVQPDGTHHIQLSYNHPKWWDDGLVYQDQIIDATQILLQQTTVTWQNDTYGPDRTRVEVTDERQQLTATGFGYGPAYNQVTDVQEYDYGGTQVLRTVHTDYETSPGYAGRHIFNLPAHDYVYRGAAPSGICESRTDYFHDGQPLADAPAVVDHVDASNPFAPRTWVPNCSRQCDNTVKPPLCQMVCDGGQWQTSYQPATDLRGNVTQVTRYADACGGSVPITETRHYDIAGNLLSVSSAPGTEERFDYTAATQYAYPTAHARGTPQLAKTHIASDEFSGVQGYQQWSYLESDNAQVTYDNNTGVWKGSASNVALIPRGGLPDDGVDAVRRWTAPAGGRVHIMGNAHSLNPTGTRIANNVVVSIRQGAQTLWQATLNSWDATGPAFDIATVVAPGDTIDFVINKHHVGNDVGGVDATWFDPTLEFTPPAATLSASASQPAVGWAWGASGASGDGSTSNRSTPGEVSALTQLVAVAAGGHSLALASDGSVWAWGNNGDGQLGDGTTTTRFSPTQVIGLGGVTTVSAGWAHSLARTKDGAVWAWGMNTLGQLGNGTTNESHTPVQVSGLTGIVAVAAGKEESFALKADGTVWAWGYNAYGNLGNGTQSVPQLTPVQVTRLSGVVAIAAGHGHTLALKSDGTVWAWGNGSSGALGNGTTTVAQSIPVPVSGLGGVVAISAGGTHSLALRNDGTVWAWGANDNGQLGVGDMTMRLAPVPVNGLAGVVGVAAGGLHSLALTGDGTLWAWESNAFGQLGNGSTATQLTPVPLTGITPAVALAAGISHSLALTTAPAQVSTTTVYEFNTGLPVSTTDANGQTTQMQYATGSLRPASVVSPTGATTAYAYDDAALSMTTTTCTAACGAGASIAAQHVTRLNGQGLARSEENLVDGGQWNIIQTQYDALRRLWKQTPPFRSGDTPLWNEFTYDAMGSVTLANSADGSQTRHFYNESTLPSTVTVSGRTERVVDAWGQERLLLRNALGQLALVVDPDPATGLVKVSGATQTTYSYNTRNQLTAVVRGVQNRTLLYDGLGRLTHQALSEKSPTLSDLGAQCSDVLTYDDRSRLTSRTDARGVTTRYDYANDPLDRLHTVTYDASGASDTSSPIVPAASVSYQYMPIGDMTRPVRVTAAGVSTTVSVYDAQGRLQSQALTLASRPDYPEITGYGYDPLSRRTDLSYPAAYGMPVVTSYYWPAPGSHVAHVGYGVAGQLSGLTVDGVPYASQTAYGAGGQLTSLTVGWVQIAPITETYIYDPATTRLHEQQIQRAGAPLLDLIYDELRPGTSSGRTGRVTQVTDTLDGQNTLSYGYNGLGHLTQAAGGNPTSPLWTQQYTYDQYGNRTGVVAAGMTESGGPVPHDGFATPTDAATNHITTAGFTYDAAGNLTRGQHADGTWLRYQYDAAGRLVNVLSDGGAILEVSTYGPNRRRLISQTGGPSPERTYYVWDGNNVISEYRETAAAPTTPQWTTLYVYLGSRLLATWIVNGTSTAVQFDHPDRRGTRLITDAADSNLSQQLVLPFGVNLNGETSTVTPLFTTYDRSAATGLDYAVNRHYDPQLAVSWRSTRRKPRRPLGVLRRVLIFMLTSKMIQSIRSTRKGWIE